MSQEDKLARLFLDGGSLSTSRIILLEMPTTNKEAIDKINLLFLNKMTSVKTSMKPWITTTKDSEETSVKEIVEILKVNRIKKINKDSKVNKMLKTMVNNQVNSLDKILLASKISQTLNFLKVKGSGANGVNLILTLPTDYSIMALLSISVWTLKASKMVLPL